MISGSAHAVRGILGFLIVPFLVSVSDDWVERLSLSRERFFPRPFAFVFFSVSRSSNGVTATGDKLMTACVVEQGAEEGRLSETEDT